MKKPEVKQNNPEFAGRLASKKTFFGEFGRLAVFAVHTRFSDVQWFVADAERPDEFGLPSIIRQAASFEEAVAGL